MSSPADPPSSAASGRHRTFVSYAREDEAFALALATALEVHGCPVWVDRWHIVPGADWTASIDAALRTCAALVVVLSPDAVASTEVQSEFGIALHRQMRVVPVLHRACDVPLRLQRTQYLDLTDAPDPTADHVRRLIDALRAPADTASGDADDDRQARHTLLDDVRDEVRERLGGLGTTTPIALAGDMQPRLLSRHWHDDVPDVARPDGRSAETVSDVAAFVDAPEVRGSLLVLGGPGSGKTTALVQIMNRWAARAADDVRQPIPVLLSLASWRGDQSIADWLVDELSVTHGVRPDRGRQWRDRGLVVPLLDGLDELPPALQSACVEALNAYRRTERPSRLVVSSRLAEYEQLPVRLELRAAVVLRPFAPAQISTYLAGAGMARRWDVVRDDPALLALAASPLLLSFMSAVPDAPRGATWDDRTAADARRRRLLDAYVAARTRPPEAGFAPEAMRAWLRALAQSLRRQGASEFLVERLQPGWLQTRVQRVAYRSGVLLVTTATIAVVLAAVKGLFGLLPQGDVGRVLAGRLPGGTDPVFNVTLLLVLALPLGAIAAARPSIVPIESLTWSWPRAARQGARWGRKGLVGGVAYGWRVGVIGGAGVVMVLAIGRAWTGGDSLAPLLAAATGAAAAGLLIRAAPDRGWHAFEAPRLFRRLRRAWPAAALYVPLALAPLADGDWRTMMLLVLGALLAAVAVVGVALVTDDGNGRAVPVLESMVVGALVGVTFGALSAATVTRAPVTVWVAVCTAGGQAVGLTSAIVRAFVRRRGIRRRAGGQPAAQRGLVAAAAIVCGVGALAAGWLGAGAAVRSLVAFLGVYQAGLLFSLTIATLGGVSGVVVGAVFAGTLGALGGVLGGGAAGADVERRLVPNQGIRQSAVNVGVFAGLGIIVIGVPYGSLNLLAAMALTGVLASPADLLRLGLGSGVAVGVLAGLIPGVACIQHGVLRVVLWMGHQLPLRCVRFLDLATRRRLLQRVGGRYRFIHATLRDHLCDDDPS